MVGDANAGAVPSLVDVVASHVADLTLLNSQELPMWLPALPTPPSGWVLGRIDADPVPTRITLHRNAADPAWDGCEVINVFAFTGSLPRGVLHANVACTLNAVGAENISTHPIFVPAGLVTTAALASGEFTMSGQRVWARYTAYVAQVPAGSVTRDHELRQNGMLVEHNTFVTLEARESLQGEIVEMGEAVYRALVSTPKQP